MRNIQDPYVQSLLILPWLALLLFIMMGCGQTEQIQGPPGERGEIGAPGVDGRDGNAGADGRDGHNGVDGQDGSSGPIGERGPQGEQGPRGVPGADGVSCEVEETPDGVMVICPNGAVLIPKCECKNKGKKK